MLTFSDIKPSTNLTIKGISLFIFAVFIREPLPKSLKEDFMENKKRLYSQSNYARVKEMNGQFD